MRSARRVLSATAVACAAFGACAPPRVTGVPDPAGARRFEIIDAGDSTFKFLASGAPWVRRGDVGVAVDPRRRDVLVARFVVQARLVDTATALITGQTSRVATTHVALLDAPRPRPLRQRTFWLGTLFGVLLGAAVGVGVASATR